MKRCVPRKRGTLFAALEGAIDELTINVVADVIGETPSWVYDAANPNRDKKKQGVLTWSQARALARAGALAVAQDMATEAGGVFMPPLPSASPVALHGALADHLNEHGQAVSEIIKRAADGEIDKDDALAALKEVDEAMNTFMAVRALLERVAQTGEALR